MDKIYVNKNFEIVNELDDNSFEVDKAIADTIITLNKKGYLTVASCSSHYYEDTLSKMSVLKTEVTKEALLEWLNENNLNYIEEDTDNYYYESKTTGLACYVKFDDRIVLPNIPTDFFIENNSIYHMITFYNDLDKKSEEVVLSEIKVCNDELKRWAASLPIYIEKK